MIVERLLVATSVVGATVFLFYYGGRIVFVALRTGRLLARGVVYSRVNTPIQYYGLLAGWLLVFAMMALASIGFLTQFP